ncbi:MAG TPA: GNAT family N-acetyltransferase [Herpetosiphonaceae bacterium]
MIEIRPGGPGELPEIVELIKAAFAEYEGLLDPPSSAQAKTVAATRAELADGGALVAAEAGRLVGCVFYHRRPDHIYLDRLAVLPAERGRGLAGALLRAVEELALAEGLPETRLSVRLALAENRAWYERCGYAFEAHGTHAGYAEPTYVRLRKPLGRD